MPSKPAANRPGMVGGMGKIITVQFRRSRLPRRLVNDGWWLESKPVRPSLIALPKRTAPKPRPRVRHLTLVGPGK
jgi:hypothetical protein